MRITVNGVEIPHPAAGVNVLVELDGDETMGPVVVEVAGGRLTVLGSVGAAVTINMEHPPLTLLGTPPKEGEASVFPAA